MTDKAPDWERIELDYRAGIKSLREIAAEHGITHGAINKRAKRDGWERDLAPKIQARAEALVSKALVSSSVSSDQRIAERDTVEANAQAVATIKLAHRSDIRRAHGILMSLFEELECQTGAESVALLQQLGEIMRSEDDKGQDRRNDLYAKIISLPERAKTAETLTRSLKTTVELQRQAFGMDKDAATGVNSEARIAVEFVRPPVRPVGDDDE